MARKPKQHKTAGKKNAVASAESREALLSAGAQLLAETTVRDPFASIRLRDVCRRAERSTGTFYSHWKDAESYHRELAKQLLVDALHDDLDELKAVAQAHAADPSAEAVLALASTDIELLLNDPQWDAVEMLNVTWARTSLRQLAIEGYNGVDAATGEAYEILLETLGRKPRAPLSTKDLGVILQALVEGFALRAKIDEAGARIGERPLYPVAVAAVLLALTAVAGDERTVDDVFAAGFSTTDA